jgi:microcystin degradation protein MlrC
MGKIAIVQTGGGNVIMLTSLRVPPFSLRQLTAFGIHPQQFNAVVAKGVNAPIAAYGPVCPTIVQVNTPGVTQADMTRFTYRHRRQPLFPFEQDIK